MIEKVRRDIYETSKKKLSVYEQYFQRNGNLRVSEGEIPTLKNHTKLPHRKSYQDICLKFSV